MEISSVNMKEKQQAKAENEGLQKGIPAIFTFWNPFG
jgi:hypothetical protein